MAHLKHCSSKIAPSARAEVIAHGWGTRAHNAVLLMTATTPATAQTYTDLYNFDGIHGRDPYTGLSPRGEMATCTERSGAA